jgi:Predicted membrane protein (DUF2142)
MALFESVSLAALAALGTALALTKQAYAPLCAAVLVIPAGRFKSRSAWALGIGAIALASSLAAGSWFLALHDLSLAPLTRTSDPDAQLAWMAAHPLETAIVIIRTMVLRVDVYVRTFVGVLGSLDVPLPGPIYLLYPAVLVAVSMLDGGSQSPVRGARRWILLGVAGALRRRRARVTGPPSALPRPAHRGDRLERGPVGTGGVRPRAALLGIDRGSLVMQRRS